MANIYVYQRAKKRRMKIIAVGMNYSAHNRELNFLPPEEPTLFMKADSSLKRKGTPFFIPDFSSAIDYETEVVIKICRLGKNIAERFAHRYYEEVTVGIDFTARDLQNRLREGGLPWEISKAFDNSAAVGSFVPKATLGDLKKMDFRLDINSVTVQQGDTQNMLFSFDTLIAYISRFFTLKTGDLIFTGTPSGIGPVHINDRLEGYLRDKKLLDFRIK